MPREIAGPPATDWENLNRWSGGFACSRFYKFFVLFLCVRLFCLRLGRGFGRRLRGRFWLRPALVSRLRLRCRTSGGCAGLRLSGRPVLRWAIVVWTIGTRTTGTGTIGTRPIITWAIITRTIATGAAVARLGVSGLGWLRCGFRVAGFRFSGFRGTRTGRIGVPRLIRLWFRPLWIRSRIVWL